MASEVEELMELLQNVELQADVRHKGWEYLLGLTTTDAGMNILLSQKAILFMLSCIKNFENDKLVVTTVYRCLINISSSKESAIKLLSYKEDFIPYLVSNICNSSKEFIEFNCYILNNLSSHNIFCVENQFSSDALQNLTKLFLSNDMDLKNKYRFLALIFANITNNSKGRKQFLQNNNYLSELFMVSANPSESIIRRLGVSLIMRNCCFEIDYHEMLLEKLNILPNLLLPLMGPEDYEEEKMEKFPIECQYLENNKTREEHPKIRRALVQSLCLGFKNIEDMKLLEEIIAKDRQTSKCCADIKLCYTEKSWSFLKENGVYYVAGELHKWETDDSVFEAVETLLLYLLVEKYAIPEEEGRQKIQDSALVLPSVTDIVKDLPDFVI